MTTGRDDASRRVGKPDLLASLPGAPGIDPAAFEELRAAVLEIREQVAGLRSGAHAEPLTPEDLAAWEEGFLKRLGGILSGELEAAEERIGKTVEQSIAGASGLEERRERVKLREAVSGVEKTLEKLEAKIRAFDGRAMRYLEGISSMLREVETALGGMQRGWWIVLGLCVTVTGLVAAADLLLDS